MKETKVIIKPSRFFTAKLFRVLLKPFSQWLKGTLGQSNSNKKGPCWYVYNCKQNNYQQGAKMTNKSMQQKREKVYVGMDVHKKNYVVSASIDNELVFRGRHTPANAAVLIESLKKWFPDHEIYSAYEAGFCGFGLHRALIGGGINNIVVNPASIEVAANDKKKCDKRDSKKIAIQLNARRLNGIYIPSETEELRRQITRCREQILKERKRIGNQIKGQLHYFGYIGADDKRIINEKYLAELESKEFPKEIKVTLQFKIDQWRFFNNQLEQIKIDFQEQSFEDGEVEEFYRSVPGVGVIGARILANELGDLSKRFSNQKSLYQYTGLTPSEHSSGPHVRKGHIDKQGSPRIRHILIEAAWIAIDKDGALKESFETIKATRGAKRAIIAIARKLIGRMRACFVGQQPYCLGLAA